MEPQDPNAPDRDPPRRGVADETLRRLEERLGRASEAAERLIAEAVGTARRTPEPPASAEAEEPPAEAASSGPPPAGWQTRPVEEDRQSGELELLLQVIRSVRDLIPPELQQRLAEALRELLMALRALIDWYLERSEQQRAHVTEVQDIPIL